MCKYSMRRLEVGPASRESKETLCGRNADPATFCVKRVRAGRLARLPDLTAGYG
jgi:hypothetical protein